MKQIQVIEGKVVAPEGMKVGIVAARFNEIIVNKLLGGAVDGLVRHGVEEENITAAWVPGAFEIPITAQKMAQSGKYDAVICVGAVIRGDTSHYDLCVTNQQKELHRSSLQQVFLFYLESLQQKILNRQLHVPEVKLAIKVMIVRYQQLRW